MHWFYAIEGEQSGPVTEEDLRELVNSGTIRADTLVWHEGMESWREYAAISRQSRDAAAETTAPCRECGRVFEMDEMVPYAATYICAACKTTFFQRLDEGGAGGNTPNSELTARARRHLPGNWGPAVGVCLVANLILSAASMAGSLGGLVVAGPLELGLVMYFLAIARKAPLPFSGMFRGFTLFGSALAVYFIRFLIVFMWSLLLLIPGIIAQLAYSMTLYILADKPEIGPMQALRDSKEMMRGRKWKYFCLNLRFIGWSLLCIPTFGIGYLWLVPYIAASQTEFYEDIRGV